MNPARTYSKKLVSEIRFTERILYPQRNGVETDFFEKKSRIYGLIYPKCGRIRNVKKSYSFCLKFFFFFNQCGFIYF